jgi:hypothetical protein
VSEARSINRAEILTARTGAFAEAAKAANVEAAAAEAAAAAGGAAKAAADALGGGAGDVAVDAEETPGGLLFVLGPERNLKLEAGRSATREQTRQSRPQGC